MVNTHVIRRLEQRPVPTPTSHIQLDIERLIEDLGGPAVVAAEIGVPRTAPYRWITGRYLSSRVMEKLVTAWPALRIDDYFEAKGGKSARRRAGGEQRSATH